MLQVHYLSLIQCEISCAHILKTTLGGKNDRKHKNEKGA